MAKHPTHPHKATATLKGLEFAAIKMVVSQDAKTNGLILAQDEDDNISIQTPQGTINFSKMMKDTQVTVSAGRDDQLFLIKERLMSRLMQFVPQAVEDLRWSDSVPVGSHPENFQFAIVKSVQPIGPKFLRVRLKAQDLTRYSDDSIHIRLVLPKNDQETIVWPSVAANGSTVWPQGEKALHNPVYTVRKFDPTTAEMDVDIFLHDGGRTTDWATNVVTGAKIGIVGPVASGCFKPQKILMFADETALPAVARTLETLPDGATGQVTILTDSGQNDAYPLKAPKGISLTWLSRQVGHNLADIALENQTRFPSHFLWFASEKADVQLVRSAYKNRGGDQSAAYLAVYWSAA